MQSSTLSTTHAGAGARLGARPEAPELDAPLTFGDVPAEYAAAHERAVLFDATDRARVRVSGKEAASFLHRILANDVHALTPGTGNANLLLSPKGKVTAMFDLMRGEDAFDLSAPPGTGPALCAALDMFLFAEDVKIEDTTDGYAPLELVGPAATTILKTAFGDLPALQDHCSVELEGELTLTPLELFGATGFRLDAGPEGAATLWERLCSAGATPAGIVLRDILRVESGSALFGVDVDDNVYPQEARLDTSFSLDKGCYVGQEVVAKIDTYGGLNKCLFALRVEHDDPIPRGTRLTQTEDGTERDLGVVTSWAYSFVLDTGLVLAYVKRRHQAEGTSFELSDGLGSATIVPFPARSA